MIAEYLMHMGIESSDKEASPMDRITAHYPDGVIPPDMALKFVLAACMGARLNEIATAHDLHMKGEEPKSDKPEEINPDC